MGKVSRWMGQLIRIWVQHWWVWSVGGVEVGLGLLEGHEKKKKKELGRRNKGMQKQRREIPDITP